LQTGDNSTFLARDTTYTERAICYHPFAGPSLRLSNRLSVRLSHGWISQKRLKSESFNFHYRVAQSL